MVLWTLAAIAWIAIGAFFSGLLLGSVDGVPFLRLVAFILLWPLILIAAIFFVVGSLVKDRIGV